MFLCLFYALVGLNSVTLPILSGKEGCCPASTISLVDETIVATGELVTDFA